MLMENIDLLNEVSRKLRIRILDMTYGAGKNGAHAGGGLSIVEILAFLYFGGVLKYDKDKPYQENRDRFILSKGHSALALFAVLEQVGFLSKEVLEDHVKAYGHIPRRRYFRQDFETIPHKQLIDKWNNK